MKANCDAALLRFSADRSLFFVGLMRPQSLL